MYNDSYLFGNVDMYNPLNDPRASTYEKMKYLGQITNYNNMEYLEYKKEKAK